MQLLPLQKLDGCRLWIATLGLALFAPAFLMSADKTQAPADTLARVRQTGTFRLGYYADAGPFSYQDETGKPAGYRSQVSFSIPIFPAGLAALVRADAPAQIRDVLSEHEPPYRPLWRGSIGLTLQNRTFSAVTNTTALNWLTGKLDEFKIDAKVAPVESHDQGVQRVLNRSSDVLFGERSILLDAKKRNPAGGDLIVLDRLFTYEPLALALARGSEDLRLLVDKSLSSLSRSGETQNLYKRFFGEPDENALTFFRMNTIAD